MREVKFKLVNGGLIVRISYEDFIPLGRRVLLDLREVKRDVVEEALKRNIDPFFLWNCFVDAYSRFVSEMAFKN